MNTEGKKEVKGFFEGGFGRYVMPAIILQSVLIGGGYATGREIVAFGAKFGAHGWIAGLAIFAGFSVIAVLTFEVARTFQAYDYRSLVKQFTWKLWFLYDLVYVPMTILVMAVMASAAGEIVQRTLGIPYWVGVLSIIIMVGVLNYHGGWLIKRFKTYGTLALYAGYILFTTLVVSKTWNHAHAVLAESNTDYVDSPVSLAAVLWTGILYVGYNLAVYPASLFSLEVQAKRKETLLAGIISGVVMTVPWFMTYFALMGFYPSERILSAPIPWLMMLEDVGNAWTVSLFGLVVGWTLIETATGMLHALMERIKVNLRESGRKPFGPGETALISAAVLLVSTALARIGIIDLVAKGYTLMGYGLIAVYALPLTTIGLYRIIRPEWKKDFWGRSQ